MANKNVTFTNAMRSDQTQGLQGNKVWLNLTNTGSAFSQTLVAYLPGTSVTFDDGYDAPQINTTGNVLSTAIDNTRYAIQARGNFQDNDAVRLHLNLATAGSFTISTESAEGILATTQNFYLKDNDLGSTHNIKLTPYTFVSAAGINTNRFELVFQPILLSVNTDIFRNENVVVFQNNQLLNIKSTQEMASVKVFDIHGRIIYEQKNINAEQAVLSNFRPQQQLLLLQITNTLNETVIKKVIF